MNDYVQRSDLSPTDRIAPVRPVPAIAPVASIPSDNSAGPDVNTAARNPVIPQRESGEGADIASASEEQLATAAEYARVHAKIADIVASMRSSGGNDVQAIAAGDGAIQALSPRPIVIVPLPPANKTMLEHAMRVAKDMVEQAAFAHAAQANIKPGTVDQMLSQVA